VALPRRCSGEEGVNPMGSGVASANVLHVLHMEVVRWPGNGTWLENRGKPVAKRIG
jgi:hypothetical protein